MPLAWRKSGLQYGRLGFLQNGSMFLPKTGKDTRSRVQRAFALKVRIENIESRRSRFPQVIGIGNKREINFTLIIIGINIHTSRLNKYLIIAR